MHDKEANSQDEEMIGKLIAAAGPGRSASPEARERVYAAVRARWESETQSNRQSNRVTTLPRPRFNTRILALAASIGVIAIAVSWTDFIRGPGASSDAVIELAVVQGEVELGRGNGTELAIQSADSLEFVSGDRLRTGANGLLALRRSDGLTLRLNVDSEIRIADAELIELNAGTIYIDSGIGISSQTLEVDTPFGTVEHLGTQYEVRLGDGALRLRIREGEVSIDNDSTPEIGTAGEQLLIGSNGAAARSQIAANDPEWDWAANIAMLERAGDYQVAETLAWIARELGLILDYDTPVARQQATTTSLSGLEGQNPRSALAIIEQTTSLTIEIADNRLFVSD